MRAECGSGTCRKGLGCAPNVVPVRAGRPLGACLQGALLEMGCCYACPMSIRYDTNVRHQGEIFRITTQVVVPGRILTQLLSAADVVLVTRMSLGEDKERMQSMHKEMFQALHEGRLAEALRLHGRTAS